MTRGVKESTETRIMDKITIDGNDCWLFNGAKNNLGYGMVRVTHRGGMGTAHRALWECLHGLLDPEVLLIHRCGVRNCVNPDHMICGDRKDLQTESRKRHQLDPHYIQKQYTCVHCGIKSIPGLINRWHGDNCKKKNK